MPQIVCCGTMQWYGKKLGRPKIIIHDSQTYSEQEKNLEKLQ
jgi:hypothetical protein